MTLIRPTLLIDPHKCRANISRMALKAKAKNLEFRPHFKTHQSAQVSEWFRAEGISNCTVSSVKMAQYFAKYSWSDILIAFPVNVREAENIQELASHISLQVLVYGEESIQLLAHKVKAPLGVKIELDLGSLRSGVSVHNRDEIDALLRAIEAVPNFRFTGFYSHPGHTYAARSAEEVIKIYSGVMSDIKGFKSYYHEMDGFSITIGDTPGCTLADDFGPVGEISPGNFVFYDVMQVNIGSCTYDDIAVVMACPVVGKNTDRHELLIHGGAVHFSKENLRDADGILHFGKLAVPSINGWKSIIPWCYLKSISQEHGLIHCSEDMLSKTQIGDMVYIYPVHSCLAANLMKSYLNTENLLMDGEEAFMS